MDRPIQGAWWVRAAMDPITLQRSKRQLSHLLPHHHPQHPNPPPPPPTPAAKGESTEDLRRLKATCKAVGKLNSEPAPPGTMMDSQVHEVLMKKLVKNTSSLLSIDALAVDRSATEEQRALADAPMQEDPPSAYVLRRRKIV